MDEPDELVEQTPDDVFLTAVLFESLLGLLALLLGWMLGPDPRESVPKLDSLNLWPVFSGLMYGCLAAVPILIAIELIRKIPWEPVRELERLSDDGVIKTLLQLRPIELVMISICAGIGEELLFRGWLLYGLAEFMCWLDGNAAGAEAIDLMSLEFGVALVGSSILFGLVHPITKLYVVLAALMGLYFGVLLLISGNLLVPIAAHATYDAVQLIMTARQTATDEAVSD